MIEKRRAEDGEILNVTHEIPPYGTASHDSSRERGPFARSDLQGVHFVHRCPAPEPEDLLARQGERHVRELELNPRLDRAARIAGLIATGEHLDSAVPANPSPAGRDQPRESGPDVIPECGADLLQPSPALQRSRRRGPGAGRVSVENDSKVHILRETAKEAVVSRQAGRTIHDERSTRKRERFQGFEGLRHAQVLLRTPQRVAIVEALEMGPGFSSGGKGVGRGHRNLPGARASSVRSLELQLHPVSEDPAPTAPIDPDHGPIGTGGPVFRRLGRDDAVAQ